MFGLFGRRLPKQLRQDLEADLLRVTKFCTLISFDKTVVELNPLLSASFDDPEERKKLTAAFNDLPRMLSNFENAPDERKPEAVLMILDMTLSPRSFNGEQTPYYGVALFFIYFMAQMELMLKIRPAYAGDKQLWKLFDSTSNILSGAYNEVTDKKAVAAAILVPRYFEHCPLGYSGGG